MNNYPIERVHVDAERCVFMMNYNLIICSSIDSDLSV